MKIMKLKGHGAPDLSNPQKKGKRKGWVKTDISQFRLPNTSFPSGWMDLRLSSTCAFLTLYGSSH